MKYFIVNSYSNSSDIHFNLSSYASILARNSIFFNLYCRSKFNNFRVVFRRLFSMLFASALICGISQISFKGTVIDHNLPNLRKFELPLASFISKRQNLDQRMKFRIIIIFLKNILRQKFEFSCQKIISFSIENIDNLIFYVGTIFSIL